MMLRKVYQLMEMPGDVPQVQPNRRGRGALFILMGLTILLILAGSVWLVINQGRVTTTPSSLANLPLSRQVTGRAAVTNIEQLHQTSFPMVDGAVAYYDDGQAVLWIFSTWLPFMAVRQVEAMTERIAEGRSPFTPAGTRQVNGITVYELTGMGQTHYYFQLDRQVVWLAVSPHLAEQSLTELIRKLQ
jgi:hypothetical protein